MEGEGAEGLEAEVYEGENGSVKAVRAMIVGVVGTGTTLVRSEMGRAFPTGEETVVIPSAPTDLSTMLPSA